MRLRQKTTESFLYAFSAFFILGYCLCIGCDHQLPPQFEVKLKIHQEVTAQQKSSDVLTLDEEVPFDLLVIDPQQPRAVQSESVIKKTLDCSSIESLSGQSCTSEVELRSVYFGDLIVRMDHPKLQDNLGIAQWLSLIHI